MKIEDNKDNRMLPLYGDYGLSGINNSSVSLRVMARITLESDNEQTITLFEETVGKFSEVKLARRLAGQAKFMLFIEVRDQIAYEEFIARRLNKIPGVSRVDSLITQKGFQTYAVYESTQRRQANWFLIH
jgi:DNA-binding Lrp family transcriptional regulator